MKERIWKKVWGILIPLWWKTEAFEDFEYIEMCHEVRVSKSKNSGSRSTTVYPVRLVQKSKKKRESYEPQDPLKSRRSAESLSRVLKIPIEDNSLGFKLQREHQEVDSNIREMLREYDVKVDKPEMPQSLKKRTQEGYDSDGEKCTLLNDSVYEIKGH